MPCRRHRTLARSAAQRIASPRLASQRIARRRSPSKRRLHPKLTSRGCSACHKESPTTSSWSISIERFLAIRTKRKGVSLSRSRLGRREWRSGRHSATAVIKRVSVANCIPFSVRYLPSWRRAVRAAPLLTAPECRSAPKALPRPKPYRAKNSTAPKALPRPKLYRAKSSTAPKSLPRRKLYRAESSTAPKSLPRRKLYRAKSSIAPKALPRRNLYRAKSSIAPRALPRPTSTAPKALPHRELYRAQSSTAPKALRCPNLYRAQSSATPKALPRRKLYRVQPLIGHRRARSCTATRAVLNIVAPVIYKRRERQQEQRESSFAAALSFCCRRRPHCDKCPISPMRLKNGGSRKKKKESTVL